MHNSGCTRRADNGYCCWRPVDLWFRGRPRRDVSARRITGDEGLGVFPDGAPMIRVPVRSAVHDIIAIGLKGTPRRYNRHWSTLAAAIQYCSRWWVLLLLRVVREPRALQSLVRCARYNGNVTSNDTTWEIENSELNKNVITFNLISPFASEPAAAAAAAVLPRWPRPTVDRGATLINTVRSPHDTATFS